MSATKPECGRCNNTRDVEYREESHLADSDTTIISWVCTSCKRSLSKPTEEE